MDPEIAYFDSAPGYVSAAGNHILSSKAAVYFSFISLPGFSHMVLLDAGEADKVVSFFFFFFLAFIVEGAKERKEGKSLGRNPSASVLLKMQAMEASDVTDCLGTSWSLCPQRTTDLLAHPAHRDQVSVSRAGWSCVPGCEELAGAGIPLPESHCLCTKPSALLDTQQCPMNVC